MPTGIPWTDEVINGVTGCTKVSPGCAHCYASMLGATVCNQPEADRIIPILLPIPAAVRFISYEPAPGPLVLRTEWIDPLHIERQGLSWVIAETGQGKRPMDIQWARDLRDQYVAAGVPYFFKRDSDGYRDIDNERWAQYPEVA